MEKTAGKTVVITGGTRGFGFVMAQAFASQGYRVMLGSRSSQALDQAAARLQGCGEVRGQVCDVTNLEQVEGLAEAACRDFGRIDVWVNNAGIAGPYGPTVEIDSARFVKVLETNITGTYYGSKAAMACFLQQGSGKLINILGHGANGPVAYQNAYASSKAWIKSFTLALAAETRTSGVGVFAFQPGMMLTDLLMEVEVIKGNEFCLKSFPAVIRILARPPEEPAQKIVWLASAATDGKTGKVYSMMSPGRMLCAVLRELGRKLAGKVKEPDVKITPIDPCPIKTGSIKTGQPWS